MAFPAYGNQVNQQHSYKFVAIFNDFIIVAFENVSLFQNVSYAKGSQQKISVDLGANYLQGGHMDSYG